MAAVEDKESLGDVYDNIWEYYESLEESSEDLSSENVQHKTKKAIDLCLDAIEKINKLNLFSSNEDIEEVTTNEIKFLLIPAFLGYFINKDISENRDLIVKKCQDSLKNFLILCHQYSLTTYKCKEENEEDKSKKPQDPIELLKSDAVNRQQKIERFKAKKLLESQLKSLYSDVKKPHTDDETKREYFLKLIEKWISDSIESLESLQGEEAILLHLKAMKMKNNGSDECKTKKPKKPSFQPFIITKDKMQKSVFGYGYPGVPTVSVDEFYDQRVRDGIFPAPSTAKKVEPNEKDEDARRDAEEAEKDEKQERDDEQVLMQARAMDEYKDTHRRGWGNRHNRS